MTELDMTDGLNTHLKKDSPLVDTYEANSIPSHYLIDKQGNFAKETQIASPSDGQKLIAQIEKLLK